MYFTIKVIINFTIGQKSQEIVNDFCEKCDDLTETSRIYMIYNLKIFAVKENGITGKFSFIILR